MLSAVRCTARLCNNAGNLQSAIYAYAKYAYLRGYQGALLIWCSGARLASHPIDHAELLQGESWILIYRSNITSFLNLSMVGYIYMWESFHTCVWNSDWVSNVFPWLLRSMALSTIELAKQWKKRIARWGFVSAQLGPYQLSTFGMPKHITQFNCIGAHISSHTSTKALHRSIGKQLARFSLNNSDASTVMIFRYCLCWWSNAASRVCGEDV